MNQITFTHSFDGIELEITAEIDNVIEKVEITGYHVYKVVGKKISYELPEAFIDEMRDKWGIDELIIDEVEILKRDKSKF